MNKYNSSTIFDKLLATLLLISGILTLLFGGSAFGRIVYITFKEGVSTIFNLDALELSTLFACAISVPIGVISLYFTYTLFNSKIESKNVFYLSTIQGIIIIYPVFSAYINPDVVIKNGTLTEKTLISSLSILGIILLGHSLYGLYYCNLIDKRR